MKTLFQVLDYQSGSSWDGGHDRNISVNMKADGQVEVMNEYSGHEVKTQLSLSDLFDQLSQASSARYYRDFCYYAETCIEGFASLQIEDGVVNGLKRPVTVTPKIRLKPIH